MPDIDKPESQDMGFPSLDWEDKEELDTRPLPMHERPIQARVDMQLAIVAAHYARVALGIENFWGQRDCVPYIQGLVFNGYKDGEIRHGFHPEVVTALLNLVELHNEAFGS